MNQPNSDSILSPDERLLLIGAGGFTANSLYLRQLKDLGVQNNNIVLIDNNEDRLRSIQGNYPGAETFLDTDHAIQEVHESGNTVAGFIIASSTASHMDAINSIVRAAHDGKIDLEKTKIWSEKPLTPPEIFAELMAIKEQHQDLNVSMGYILRFSEAVGKVLEIIEEQGLTIDSIDWKYGKDRTKDTRPTQGVFPDEVVHPLSVTDMLLISSFGQILDVDVESSQIQNREFVNREVQEKARVTNPGIPENPTSDVDTKLVYITGSGLDDVVPVQISSSFLFDRDYRRAEISLSNDGQKQTITLEFDERITDADGNSIRADIVRNSEGEIVYFSSADKALRQLTTFFAEEGEDKRALGTIETEARIQGILTSMSLVATESTVELKPVVE